MLTRFFVVIWLFIVAVCLLVLPSSSILGTMRLCYNSNRRYCSSSKVLDWFFALPRMLFPQLASWLTLFLQLPWLCHLLQIFVHISWCSEVFSCNLFKISDYLPILVIQHTIYLFSFSLHLKCQLHGGGYCLFYSLSLVPRRVPSLLNVGWLSELFLIHFKY